MGVTWSPDELLEAKRRGMRIAGDNGTGDTAPARTQLERVLDEADLSEADEHARVIAWARDTATLALYPALDLLYHPANGGYRPMRVAAEMKSNGVLAGVPDLCLPVPVFAARTPLEVAGPNATGKMCFSALYVELKARAGELTDAQERVMHRLEQHHCAVATCWRFKQARAAIIEYLTDPESFISGI